MQAHEASELLAGAIPDRGGVWADLGAGEGTFTRALATRLGPDARVYAVDRDRRALGSLKRWAARHAPQVIPVLADFTGAFELPGNGDEGLDGMLLANALHFVRDPEDVLRRLVGRLRVSGRLVLVEYDRRAANPWVPYPIPIARLQPLAASAGLSAPVVTTRTRSAFGGELYVAIADRRAPEAL